MRTSITSAVLVFAALFATVTAARAADFQEYLGRVAAVKGSATAVGLDGSTRALGCNDPIFAGDRVTTTAGSAVGLFLSDYYAGLDQSTTASLRAGAAAGAPKLSLESGHARMLDGGRAGEGALETPGMLAANVGADAEAFVFNEKAWVVSMICPRSRAVKMARLSSGVSTGESLDAGAGSCAIAKAPEPLYLADASHAPLGVIADRCPLGGGALAKAADRFGAPLPVVALGPASLVGSAGPPPMLLTDPRLPCDNPGAGCISAAAPFAPPVNPLPVPGGPPGGFPGGGLN